AGFDPPRRRPDRADRGRRAARRAVPAAGEGRRRDGGDLRGREGRAGAGHGLRGRRAEPGQLPAGRDRGDERRRVQRRGVPRHPPADLPPLKKLSVTPPARVLQTPARWQQLAAVATFGEAARDVTRLTVYSSSDPSIADVSPTGLVEFKRPGEVAILCRYL